MADPAPLPKITYATLRADNADLHAAYEAGIERARSRLGDGYENYIDGTPRGADEHFEVRSPIDTDILVATVATGTRQDVKDAVAAARAAQPAWRNTPWRERLAILRRAADLISERQMEYGALVAYEVGKSRIETLGEVEEAADLIRYYGDVFERENGYEKPMDNLGDPRVHTRSVLRPFGVFAVISPFNFPMALAMGPSAGAMIAGNTVILKPASAAALSGLLLAEAIRDAGVPDGVFNIVCGPGSTVGAELQENEGIDGIVFTGSYEVGMGIFRTFSRRYPKPTIIEMGGKNPAIVTATADLDEAAEGIMRSAFGFGGQKCSANSRVYVDRRVHDEFVRLLVEKAEKIVVGDPLERATLARPGHRPGCGRPLPEGRGGGPARRPCLHRRRADHRGLLRPRVLRGAHGGRRPPGRPPALPGRALRPDDGRLPGRLARRGARARERQPLRPHRRASSRGSPRRSRRSSTRSRRASST